MIILCRAAITAMSLKSPFLFFLSFQTIHADTIDLSDKSLQVDISDALSEKDKVKFTVHTKTTLPEFYKPENLVVRQHEEFVWLHDRFEENEEYAGYIVCIIFVLFSYHSLIQILLYLNVVIVMTDSTMST